MKKIALVSAAVGLAVSLAVPVIADGHANAIAARKDVMKTYGGAMRTLGGMANGSVAYDAAAASAAAASLFDAATMDQTGMWLEGTAQGTVADTRAAPAIWDNADGFAAEVDKMAAAATALNAASGNGLAELQAAMGAVGASCGSCHKTYRGPKN